MPTQKSHGLARFFVAKKRGRGPKATTFMSLRDNAPYWMIQAVRSAHNGDLPNDWIYAECYAACKAIDEGYLTEDLEGQYSDGRVDIYTNDVMQWAADMCLSATFSEAEETMRECGGAKDSVSATITSIQYFAISSIASTVLQAIAEQNESEES